MSRFNLDYVAKKIRHIFVSIFLSLLFIPTQEEVKMANSGGLKANSWGLKANSRGLKVNSGGLKANSGGLKANSGALKANSGALKAPMILMKPYPARAFFPKNIFKHPYLKVTKSSEHILPIGYSLFGFLAF